MGDWGRIHRHLHKHPKVQQVSLEAMGLWTLCNSWSRDNRTAGFIPDDCPLLEGRCHLVTELIDAGLWELVDGGVRFHDWAEHNGDFRPATTAARLVGEVLGDRFPNVVRQQVTGKVAELLEEGQEVASLKGALKMWAERPNANVNLLPHLVADVIRKDRSGDLANLIRDCWVSHDVTPLRKFGHWFPVPSAPRSIKTPDEMVRFMRAEQRKWLEQLAKEHGLW